MSFLIIIYFAAKFAFYTFIPVSVLLLLFRNAPQFACFYLAFILLCNMGAPHKKTGSYQRTDSTNITATLYSIQMDLVLWHQEFNNFFHIFCNSSLLAHTRFSALQSFPFKTKSGDLVFSFTPGMMIILQILLKLLLKNDFGRIFDSFNLLFCYAC
jgi:hypothetical protein